MRVIILVFVPFVLCYADAAIAPFITACKTADTSCHRSSAQQAVSHLAAGVPALGINALDPMTVERVKATQSGLDMDFKNTVVKGLRNCQVLSLSRNGKKTNLEIKCSVVLIGDYKLGGKLLIMPIEGTGKYKIKIRDIVVKIEFTVGERTAGAQKFWTVTSWKHSADVKTGAHFEFQNLFNGNKQLADAVHKFANSSWKEIFQEVAPPIVQAIVSRIVEEVKKLFEKVPLSELSLD